MAAWAGLLWQVRQAKPNAWAIIVFVRPRRQAVPAAIATPRGMRTERRRSQSSGRLRCRLVAKPLESHPTWHWATKYGDVALRIDFVFHTASFRTIASRVIKTPGSDHYLLVSELAQ